MVFKIILIKDLRALKRKPFIKDESLNFRDIIDLLFSYTGHSILLIRLLTTSKARILSYFIRQRLRRKYLIEIGNNVVLGSPIIFPHPKNIIISDGVLIGDFVQINQNVTIGGNNKKTIIRKNGEMQKLPIIKNRVMIYANSVIAGPIIIGENCLIGANCTITRDLEPNSMIYSQNMTSKKKIKVNVLEGTFTVL